MDAENPGALPAPRALSRENGLCCVAVPCTPARPAGQMPGASACRHLTVCYGASYCTAGLLTHREALDGTLAAPAAPQLRLWLTLLLLVRPGCSSPCFSWLSPCTLLSPTAGVPSDPERRLWLAAAAALVLPWRAAMCLGTASFTAFCHCRCCHCWRRCCCLRGLLALGRVLLFSLALALSLPLSSTILLSLSIPSSPGAGWSPSLRAGQHSCVQAGRPGGCSLASSACLDSSHMPSPPAPLAHPPSCRRAHQVGLGSAQLLCQHLDAVGVLELKAGHRGPATSMQGDGEVCESPVPSDVCSAHSCPHV